VSRTKSADRPKLRLLWDEQLSVPVAKALRELGFNVTWVGSTVHQDVPPKGASDEQVIAFAAKTNQVIVTSNHDMMLLCHEANQRFVWIDPRGRQLSREQQVVLCFSQIARWEEILGDDTEVCVRALRTKASPITSSEAFRLAERRFKAIQRKRRARQQQRTAEAELQLVPEEDETEPLAGEV
jgi:predicted nuclease of predicted toxin-antitoxin system